MATTVRLLGRPCIEVDGRPGPRPRGQKCWAVLAFVLLTERPPGRQRLAALLFDGAADPMGALRWTLAELRRALRCPAALTGDPIAPGLPSGIVVDVLQLTGEHSRRGAPEVDHPAGELLEGLAFAGCDAFQAWLLVERRRIGAAVEAALREAGLARLASGRPGDAALLATRLVALNPLDEAHHALLVRSLAAAGDRRAALQAVAACGDLFRRELGTSPSPAVRAAAEAPSGRPSPPALTGIAAARAQLAAGRAAIAAGVIEGGLDCLRRAVDEARFADDLDLLVTALTELGSALVHSARGRDEEGASVLHEALSLARSGRPIATAAALRELGFVDVQAGRRARAGGWLERAHAEASARQDDGELAAIGGVQGMNLSDQARYPEALAVFTDSIDRARRVGSLRQAAWSATLLGRLHLLRGDLEQADVVLHESLQLVETERWIAFEPLPQAFRAELELLDGRTTAAERRLAEAFALACQLGDPCWEGLTERGLGLLYARDDPSAGLDTLLDARARCLRWPDAYQWVHGYVLDAICSVADQDGGPPVPDTADQLLELAARTDMRELVCRAHLHRARAGVAGAQAAAALAAADIDNPALHRLVDRGEAGAVRDAARRRC